MKKLILALLFLPLIIYGADASSQRETTTTSAAPSFKLSLIDADSDGGGDVGWCFAVLYERHSRNSLPPEIVKQIATAAADWAAPATKKYEDFQTQCVRNGDKNTEGGTEKCLRSKMNKKEYEAIRAFKDFNAYNTKKRLSNVELGTLSLACSTENKSQVRSQTQEREIAEAQRQRTTESRQTEAASQSSAEQWLKLVDGNWISKQWKYGYQLKNGVGTATATNSPNFQIGQKIIQLTARSATTFVGQQVYTDGKFYNITVSLQGDGRLYFEGEKNAKWFMEKVKDKISTKVDLFFTADQTALTPEGKKLLDQVAALTLKMELDAIVLQGYSALIDSETVSLDVSRLRAASAKAYLVSQGIDGNRIFVEAKGTQNSIGNNSTAEGRAKNNRVNIDINGHRK